MYVDRYRRGLFPSALRRSCWACRAGTANPAGSICRSSCVCSSVAGPSRRGAHQLVGTAPRRLSVSSTHPPYFGYSLVSPIREGLNEMVWSWDILERFSGSFASFFHPGSLLFISNGVAAIVTRKRLLLAPAFAAALRRLASVAPALLLMIALARVMVRSGLVGELAKSAAHSGTGWPLFAAFVVPSAR